VQGKEFVAGCGRVLCGAVSHGYAWCGREIAVRRGEVWFSQVWSRKVWQGRGFVVGYVPVMRGGVRWGVVGLGMDIKVF